MDLNTAAQQDAVDSYNSIANKIQEKIDGQNQLKGASEAAIAAYNASPSQATADAANAATRKYNEYVTEFGREYSTVFQPELDKQGKILDTLKQDYAVLDGDYEEAIKAFATKTDTLSDVLDPIYRTSNRAFVEAMDEKFNAEQYRTLNNLGDDVDVYEHYLSKGQFENAPTHTPDEAAPDGTPDTGYSDTDEEVQDWQDLENSGTGTVTDSSLGYSDTGEEVQDWQNLENSGTGSGTGTGTGVRPGTGTGSGTGVRPGTGTGSNAAANAAAQAKAAADAAKAAQAKAAADALKTQRMGNLNTLTTLLAQDSEAGGKQAAPKTPDPAKIGYIYDFNSIFANPAQEKMFASTYAQGGMVDDSDDINDELLKILKG